MAKKMVAKKRVRPHRKSPRLQKREKAVLRRRLVRKAEAVQRRLEQRVHHGIELFRKDPVFVALTRAIHSHEANPKPSERGRLTMLRKAQEKLVLGELSQGQYHWWWHQFQISNTRHAPYIEYLLNQNRPQDR